MKRNLLFAALTCVGLSGAYVLAQAPMSDMGKSTGQAAPMSGDMKGMMEKMTPEMKMRCTMVMSTAIIPSDPAAILSLKTQLKLTDDQTTRLDAINKESQEKAAAVLTVDQKKTLETMPKTPQTMMDMHEQMMGQMQTMMGGKMGDQMMNCPMMNMMGASTTQPAHDMKNMPAVPKP